MLEMVHIHSFFLFPTKMIFSKGNFLEWAVGQQSLSVDLGQLGGGVQRVVAQHPQLPAVLLDAALQPPASLLLELQLRPGRVCGLALHQQLPAQRDQLNPRRGWQEPLGPKLGTSDSSRKVLYGDSEWPPPLLTSDVACSRASREVRS